LSLGNYGIFDNTSYCRVHHERMQMMSASLTAALSTSITNKDSFVPKVEEQKISAAEKKQMRMETSNAVAEKVRKNADAEKCESCGKTVYMAERMELDIRGAQRILLHKNCFRCRFFFFFGVIYFILFFLFHKSISVCNTLLNVSSYGSIEGRFYCPKDLKQATTGKKIFQQFFLIFFFFLQFRKKIGIIFLKSTCTTNGSNSKRN
jgi:hypothetical protein